MLTTAIQINTLTTPAPQSSIFLPAISHLVFQGVISCYWIRQPPTQRDKLFDHPPSRLNAIHCTHYQLERYVKGSGCVWMVVDGCVKFIFMGTSLHYIYTVEMLPEMQHVKTIDNLQSTYYTQTIHTHTQI